MRSNVSLLGRLLSEVISEAEGAEFLAQIERIRSFSKSSSGGSGSDQLLLQETLRDLATEQLLPVARAFSQFLNLANIADLHHNISRETEGEFSANHTL